MNSFTIEPKKIIFGPPPPNKLQIGPLNDKTQLANNYTTTFVLLGWLFLTLSS